MAYTNELYFEKMKDGKMHYSNPSQFYWPCIYMYCLTETSMTGGAQFDPFNQARLPAPPLEGKAEERLVVDSM